MIINHNMASLNTYRQMENNTVNSSKSLEKLSSGLRINKAGDDAAGLAISEKMRGQIRGLDQASRNSQDGISMLQTAEGSLSETHAILQRMKELATQSANDTNVGSDREEIQKEVNQLSSEINRIGNTTEFNTKSLLKGDGKANLAATSYVSPGTKTASGAVNTVEATQTIGNMEVKAGVTASNSLTVTLNGKSLTVNLVNDASMAADGAAVDATSATANSITVKYKATADTDISAAIGAGFTSLINKDADLAGNFTAAGAAKALKLDATKGGTAAGASGSISIPTATDLTVAFWKTAVTAPAASVGTTTDVKSTVDIDLAAITTPALAQGLVGKGMTINDQQIEFYNADAGAYTGNATGINISELVKTGASVDGDAVANAIVAQANGKIAGVTLSNTAASDKLTVTATAVGAAGDNIEIKDGGVQKEFKATFQVGANKGQSFTVDINDMRSQALGVTAKAGTAGFKATNSVTDGTSETTKEAALDVSSNTSATAAIETIDNAIQKVSAERSKIGAFTNRLDHTITNLGTSSENLTAAESRVRDVDMAKEMMQFQKNNILTQAAQAMMAQANQQPQGVLQLLR